MNGVQDNARVVAVAGVLRTIAYTLRHWVSCSDLLTEKEPQNPNRGKR